MKIVIALDVIQPHATIRKAFDRLKEACVLFDEKRRITHEQIEDVARKNHGILVILWLGKYLQKG